MKNIKARTDLALEARESFPEDDVEIKGVVLTEDFDEKNKIRVSTVEIKDEKGSKAMDKPIGSYITIEAEQLNHLDKDYHKPVSNVIIENLIKLTGDITNQDVLIVGLGNRQVTPDALGPWVVDNLFVTRHLIKEYGSDFKDVNKLGNISAISPGVMGQTGMESLEIIKGIINETKAKLLIVVDALASRSVERLNKTVQLTDTGISPGSGIGSNRKALNEENLGIKVIAIGVPTVVDAATIVGDSLFKYLENSGFTEREIYTFVSEVKEKQIQNMFVTPKDIDESLKKISYTISEALNSYFAPTLNEH